jgi:6-pyruvoyltetrahydropterin/6-carboxytetrahydropterin synthase
MKEVVSVVRKEHFNAAHRLFNSYWSDEKNDEVFGLCNNPNYHGHNYTMEVKVSGEINSDTGYVVDLKWLSDVIKAEVLDRFDHKNLNLDTEEFKNLNPTAENIVVVIYRLIKSQLPENLALQIRLWETPRNSVVFPAK